MQISRVCQRMMDPLIHQADSAAKARTAGRTCGIVFITHINHHAGAAFIVYSVGVLGTQRLIEIRRCVQNTTRVLAHLNPPRTHTRNAHMRSEPLKSHVCAPLHTLSDSSGVIDTCMCEKLILWGYRFPVRKTAINKGNLDRRQLRQPHRNENASEI